MQRILAPVPALALKPLAFGSVLNAVLLPLEHWRVPEPIITHVEHLETIELMPDPSDPNTPAGHLEIELLRDKSVLIIKTPDQQSFQLSIQETKHLIAVLQRGLQRILRP